jgi:lipopolysaccharide export LptBFGC system permease protein LptF
MKNLFITLLTVILLTSISFPQQMKEKGMKNREKLEQLEKIKLIEALDLDEETSIRFFARRNDSKKEIQELEMKAEDIISELEKSFNSENKNQSENQKQLISEMLKTRESIELKRNQFISSIYDILTVEQIGKLIVFEKKFRDEIRQVLFDKKRH